MLALLKNILSGATCINFVMRMKSLSKYTLFPWMRRILEMATLFGDFSAAEAEDILESQPKLQKKGPSTDKDKEALYESMEIFTNKLKKYATGLDINQLDRTQAQKFDTGLFRHCMQALDIVLEFRGRHGRHQPKLQTRNLLVCLIPLLVGGFVWFFTPTYVITVPIALMALLGSVVVVSPLCVGAGLSVVAVGAYALYHLVSKERPKWNDVNVTMETYLLAIQKTMRVHHMLATFLKLPHGINEEENVKIRQQWIDEHEPRGRKSAMIPNDVEFPDAKNPEFLKILLEQFKIFVEKSGEKMELHLAEVKYEPKHQATDGNGNLSEKSNDSGKTPKS
ncbi:hypothetical protein DFH27DRAFT_64021 [Peziza echinospora]|nr:hypothetical protein DFH27DRAFT_64021 [Peziza echinospora]